MKPAEILARAAQRALFAREPDGRYEIITAAATDTAPSNARIQIYGAIGDWWDGLDAATLASQINDLDVDEIEVHLNSPGGIAFDGIAIFNALRQHDAKVKVSVDGLAASAASIIAMAGDEVIMATGSQMMIHNASGLCYGQAKDMRDVAEILDKISGSISDIYVTKAGGTSADWQTVMDAETWYTADEAVAAGLADAVDKTAPVDDVENAFDLTIFAHAGRSKAAPPPAIPDFRAHKSPAEPGSHNPQKGADMPSTLTTGIRNALGIPADRELTEEQLLAAVGEALDERAETTIPTGTVLIDQAVLDQLQASAAQGAAAREQQLTDRREGIITAALRDGRITAASADDWRDSLTGDPAAVARAEKLLSNLARNAVPVTSKGYEGGVDEATDEGDAIYAKAWGTPETGKVA